MNEKIVNNCRTLVALWDTFDDLHFMRIHNEANCKAFTENIKQTCKILLEELKEIEDEL